MRWQTRRTRASPKASIGPLEGLPLAIKDLFCTKGVRTTAGSNILSNFVPPYESTVTQNLWDAGAVMLGKTNMDEFAMGSSNETSYFKPVFNPWRARNSNRNLVPGGSSGGSAAAVAADLCLGATGTDTGGSIRQPAAVTGTVGLKPTYGRCSRFGHRRVRLVARSGGSHDAHGARCRDPAEGDGERRSQGFHQRRRAGARLRSHRSNGGVKGLRVGIPKEYRIDGAPPEIEALWAKGAEWLKAQGAEIVDVCLPHTKYALPTYYIVAPAEASSNLARYDGVRFGHRAKGVHDIIDLYEKSRAEGFGAEVQRRILIGTYVLSAGYYDAYYSRAQKLRTLIARDFSRAFEKCDVLLTPATPGPAFAVGEKTADPVSMYLNDVFTVTVNLAGLPGISVPAGLTPERPAAGTAADRQGVRRSDGAARRPRGRAGRRLYRETRKPGGGRHERTRCKLIKGQTGDWEIVIGMEVHAQVLSNLQTIFRRVDRIRRRAQCAGQLRRCRHAGHAAGHQRNMRRAGGPHRVSGSRRRSTCTSVFDRKNYFYPDLPPGYQIIAVQEPDRGRGRGLYRPRGGETARVGIERLHLEQDAGKSLHDQHPDQSYVDLNRAGIALMEIVTKPDMRSSEEAAAFLRKLRAIVRYLGTCDGNMDEGSMRADVNVSVRKPGGPLGTRCEIKNVNSMRFIAQAVEYRGAPAGRSHRRRRHDRARRHACSTRKLGETRSMRSKEDAHDYRYFPDPDLLPLELDAGLGRRHRGVPAGIAGREEGALHARPRTFRL